MDVSYAITDVSSSYHDTGYSKDSICIRNEVIFSTPKQPVINESLYSLDIPANSILPVISTILTVMVDRFADLALVEYSCIVVATKYQHMAIYSKALIQCKYVFLLV